MEEIDNENPERETSLPESGLENENITSSEDLHNDEKSIVIEEFNETLGLEEDSGTGVLPIPGAGAEPAGDNAYNEQPGPFGACNTGCNCAGGTVECVGACECDCGHCVDCDVCGVGSCEEPIIIESSVTESYQDNLEISAQFIESYTGASWKICVIREGWSLNNRYYSREVLERDKGNFEDIPIAMWGYTPESRNLNHLPPNVRNSVPEGLVKNTVGWVENVRSEISEDGKYSIVGDFHCIDEALAKKLSNAWAKGKKNLLGFSIDAAGELITGIAEGRKGPVVNRIIHGNEVTLVHRPAAGGKFLDRLVACLNDEDETSEKELTTELTTQENINNGRKQKMDENNVNNVQENNALLDEMSKLRLEMEAQKTALVEAQLAAKLATCKSNLLSRLKESKLEGKAAQMIKKQFDGRLYEEEELEGAISEVSELLASVAPAVQVSQPSVSVGAEPQDKMEAALDLCFGYDPAKDSTLSESQKSIYASIGKPSFKKVYMDWNDDHDLTFSCGANSIQEATTADLGTTLANSMGRALFQRYNELPQLWRPFVTINQNVDNFKTQTRILLSGMGSQNSVSESTSVDTYTDGGFFTEDSITYHINTVGMTQVITRKMMINDDLNALKEIPRKMARIAQKELNEYVFGLVTGNRDGGGINTDTAYDGVVYFHDNHRNKGTTALSHTSLMAAINALSTQYEYGVRTTVTDNPLTNSATTINLASTGGLKAGQYIIIEAEIVKVGTVASATQLTGCTRAQMGTTAAQHASTTQVNQLSAPLDLMKYHLLYPMELRDTVNRVLNSTRGVSGTANNDNNIFTAMVADSTLVPMAVPTSYLGGDSNNWYLLAFPDQIDMFELAFLMDKQTPETWLQDNPTVDNVFKRDNLTYKMRHEYGGTGLDWRGMYAGIVA